MLTQRVENENGYKFFASITPFWDVLALAVSRHIFIWE